MYPAVSAGLALFAVASAACALAPNAGSLIASRALQGAGAAAIGMFSAVTGISVALGPLIGGVVTHGLSWQWIFLLNVPIGLVAAPLAQARLPESFGPNVSVDVKGLTLIPTPFWDSRSVWAANLPAVGRKRRPDALRHRPLEPPYRLLRLWPARRAPIRFTEDPREWIWSPTEPREPDRLPHWRSLKRAKRRAVGTVIYSRQATRLLDEGPVRSWSNVMAVAYRPTPHDLWVTDWDALETVERWRTRSLEHSWDQDFLSEADLRFLEVMRVARSSYRGQAKAGRMASWLMGEDRVSNSRVDCGWIREIQLEDHRRCYEVAIGAGHYCDLVGYADELSEATTLVRGAVALARDHLVERLGAIGGVASEFAACRAKWPEPDVRFVPYPVDRAAAFERLRRKYEELRRGLDDRREDDLPDG